MSSRLHRTGCRICGRTPLWGRDSVFKLCQEHVDAVFPYVHQPTDSTAMRWLDRGPTTHDDLRRRTRMQRARYRAAVRLLGWEVAA